MISTILSFQKQIPDVLSLSAVMESFTPSPFCAVVASTVSRQNVHESTVMLPATESMLVTPTVVVIEVN